MKSTVNYRGPAWWLLEYRTGNENRGSAQGEALEETFRVCPCRAPLSGGWRKNDQKLETVTRRLGAAYSGALASGWSQQSLGTRNSTRRKTECPVHPEVPRDRCSLSFLSAVTSLRHGNCVENSWVKWLVGAPAGLRPTALSVLFADTVSDTCHHPPFPE